MVPGDAARFSSRGSNRLLAEGATVLLDPADLIRQLGPGPLQARHALRIPLAAVPLAADEPAGDEAALLAALAGGASLEQLCLDLQSSASSLAPRLLALELAGRIRSEPGLQWRLL